MPRSRMYWDQFRAFRANRRLHYHIKNAALVSLACAWFIALFFPTLIDLSKGLGGFAVAVLLIKFCFQPKVICRVSKRLSSEYTTVAATRMPVSFPQLYLAYTGK